MTNMPNENNVTILAPAYNEEKNIPLFVTHFLSNVPNNWKILIIDDGSEDGSKQVLNLLAQKHDQLSYISHKKNMGLGKALESGFHNIETDYVITIDCDLSHKFDVVQELYNNRHKADVVMASLSHPKSESSSASKIRVVIAKIGNFLLSYMFGTSAKEIAGGPRIYTSKSVKNLNLKYSGFEAQTEILIRLLKNNFTVSDCKLYLYKRKYGESKMPYIKTIIGIIKIYFTIYLTSKN
jgi:dolichol-phosphate mannosyltransferase